jgi:HEAT repeat protein
MTKRRTFWSLALLFVLGALAVLLPISPAYAPKLFARYVHLHEGHGPGYWADALNDPDPQVRHHAIFALGVLGSDSEGSVPALSAIMVDDPDAGLRVEASLALSKMGPSARGAVPSLARALEDDNPVVRFNAARTLGELGTDARPAVPALIKAVKADDNSGLLERFNISLREVLAVALGRASAGTDEGVATLIETLEGARTSGIRRGAARGLGAVGPSARPAEAQLRALLDDKDGDVRDAAASALKQIGAAPQS